MNPRKSIATIDNPEFINLQPLDISPMISACEIKVLYIGQNRNGSAISKSVATDMSKTLRGCPIVGWYKNEKEDFGDHGDQLVIDGDGFRFNCLTKPYGFIAPDAKVWFQFFEDTDEFGNTCVREYLMAQGYLWTGQFPECQRALDNKNPHSMELDEETLKGHWATDNNSKLEFFIIDEAIFSKLCILGEDVEPCFEGSNISKPEISSTFSKEEKDFVKELASMAKELNFSLNNRGGLSMPTEETKVVEQQETPEKFSNDSGSSVENAIDENKNVIDGEFSKKEEEPKEEENKGEGAGEDPKAGEEKKNDKGEEDDKKDKKDAPAAKNSLVEVELSDLKKEYSELQEKFSALEKENKELLSFKENIENEKKDELIASFYMLSDEDKKDVIANKANYSLDDIEKELSVICVRKKVNFNLDEDKEEKEQDQPPVTFSLNSVDAEVLPPWLKAVDNIKNSEN